MQITKEKPKFNIKWLLIAALGAGAIYFFKDKFGFLRRRGKELTFEPGAIDYPEYVRPNTLPFPNYKPIEQSLTDCLSAAGNDLRAQPNCIKLANRAIAMATNNYQNKNWGGGGSHNWGGGSGHGSPRPSKPKPIPRHSPGRCINVGSISICPGCIRVGSRVMVGCKGGGGPSFPRPSPFPRPRPSSKWAWWKHGPHRSHHYWSHDHRWWWDSRGRRWRGQHERDDDDGRGGWSGGGRPGGGGAGYPGHRYSPTPQAANQKILRRMAAQSFGY